VRSRLGDLIVVLEVMRCAARKHEAQIVDVDAIVLKNQAYLGSELNSMKVVEIPRYEC
jgi:hypothetical protein